MLDDPVRVDGADLTLGFGCLWNRPRERTWSHTASSLLSAIDSTGSTADLGYDPRFRNQLYRLRYLRYRHGRVKSSWRYRETPLQAAADAIQRRAIATNTDVILTIADIGIFDRPFLVYQDLSYDLVLREIRSGNRMVRSNFQALTVGELEGLAARQAEVFRRAARVLAMSDWYARSLIHDTGLEPDRIAVVRPGATASLEIPPLEFDQRRRSLLFVGRDFGRKGGDLAVEAVRCLRAAGSDVSLTIAGPSVRPALLDDEPWIDFRGDLPAAEIAELMRSHAAFVLPTRFEAYGIVFHEALRAGTPCVGPNAFAIPEIVTDGTDGALFESWTADSVAGAISRVLTPAIQEGAFASAPSQASRLSWRRAAVEVRAVASQVRR